ncbi:dienelactone hydrolase family protein [Cohnella lupini]|uniref:Serine aminopeptidase S33 family n=1 Tax=Cohnella lupini TaxID=1294267 RepID=A0A3D9I2I1_9BACL|nr:alpha/beta hydrolase [Cohnella lupini]RED55964.1 serine aminopeptidase S33 family [Cohnella lupini]
MAKSLWKKPQGLLIVSLALMIIGSFLAGMFHTSFYSVKVKEISFDADHGQLHGLLYMPDGAGPDNPRPVIVTTHGYLNSKEMQDAPAIEMSRRGYIVLALDMYDHGDSRWTADIPAAQMFSTFWIYSQFDAAKYIYDQPYTLKDETGNAYVAVSGHSMGGFSSLLAMYFDEMNALQSGHRMIYAGIAAGADFSYAGAIAPQDQLQAAYGSRTVGILGGKYDEFFFNKSDAEKTPSELEVKGTVRSKDFTATLSGKSFLGVPADQQAEAGKFYTVQSGDVLVEEKAVRPSETGERVIYTPNQTHPWNHFSPTATADLIKFYNHAFTGVATSDIRSDIGTGNQIWWLKEAFNGVALVGFFLMFVPLISLLLKAPFLRKSVTESVAAVSAPATGLPKALYWIAFAFSVLFPAILFPTLMDKSEGGMNTLIVISLVLLGLGVVGAIAGFATKKRNIGTGSALLAVVSLVLWLVFDNASSILKLGSAFNEPTTNQVGYWAISVALIVVLLMVAFHYFLNKKAGTSFSHYGISLKPVAIVASLCTAIIAVVIGYALLFALQGVFGTDFRLWVLAVRTFEMEHVVTALRYLPFFLFYYFVSVVALNTNTRGRKGGYLLSIILNVGGLVLWLIAQYGKDFLTGVSLYPGQALNGILLFALVPCLVVAAIYARKLFEKTNNVWLASFVNTILFTMITVANTALFWNLV